MTSSKYDYANYNQFVTNFDMTYLTIQLASAQNLKSVFGLTKAKLWTEEVGEFSVM